MKKIFQYLLLVVCIFTAFILTVFAAQYYKSDPNTTITVNEHGICKKVVNDGNLSRSYFIPTNTAEEWSSFQSADSYLTDISLNNCEVNLSGEYSENPFGLGLVDATGVSGSGNSIYFYERFKMGGDYIVDTEKLVNFSGNVETCYITRIKGVKDKLEIYGSPLACKSAQLDEYRESISITGAIASGDVIACVIEGTRQGFLIIRGNGNKLDFYSNPKCDYVYRGSITFEVSP